MKVINNQHNFPENKKTFLLSQLFLLNNVLLKIDVVVGTMIKIMWRETIKHQIQSSQFSSFWGWWMVEAR